MLGGSSIRLGDIELLSWSDVSSKLMKLCADTLFFSVVTFISFFFSWHHPHFHIFFHREDKHEVMLLTGVFKELKEMLVDYTSGRLEDYVAVSIPSWLPGRPSFISFRLFWACPIADYKSQMQGWFRLKSHFTSSKCTYSTLAIWTKFIIYNQYSSEKNRWKTRRWINQMPCVKHLATTCSCLIVWYLHYLWWELLTGFLNLKWEGKGVTFFRGKVECHMTEG